ncbi:hypothetical protein ELUMI_v1c08250 [Williamsoniiplasma luminosum]|uniref:BspA family leucine-rich repeat surface protein n=1 Tax=Williamsoniiplasma luminosum TaxID=214888 RepID=A0A2K8NVH6_9MOLU|nr:BspA family leucine-rich repeat surface protein [Williamsoniiplasma luminosum]ATZ17546.1 hypothetical protein ELUMI_v1c08250 [Williamsoniiplasma luminosum]
MKKLLTLLGSILVFGGSVTTVVACTSQIIYFTPITSIENELQEILNIQQDQPWKLKDLQTEVDTWYGAGTIKVNQIKTSTYSSNSINHPDKYRFVGEKIYIGSIILTHNWTEPVDNTQNISTIRTELNNLLKEKPNTAWNENELQQKIDEKWPLGGVNFIKISSPRASHEQLYYEQYLFFGKGNEDNPYQYFGAIMLIHDWRKTVDDTLPISDIKTSLKAILDMEENEAWNLKDLQTKIDEVYGLDEIIVESTSSIRSSNPGETHNNNYLFTGKGNANNEHWYSGTISLTHTWNPLISTTQDISLIQNELEKIVLSQEQYWTKETLEQAIVDQKLDINGGITVSEVELSKEGKIPVKQWKFTGQGNVINEYKYDGSLEIYQVEDKETFSETIYVDANDHKIKMIDGSAPGSTTDPEIGTILSEGTKEVIHIGWHKPTGGTDDYKAYQMPQTIEKVPPYISPQIKQLFQTFEYTNKFNDANVSKWNTSNIITMENMFRGAKVFNQPLNMWNTSKVTDMNTMFYGADEFSQDLNGWDTSQVKLMDFMFAYTQKFNGDISQWDTSNVSTTTHMFHDARAFNQDLIHDGKKWNTSNVEDMNYMFYGARAFNGDISNWDTSNVETMEYMFSGALRFNPKKLNWNVKKVWQMSEMFSDAKKFNGDISNWDTSRVTEMHRMFNNSLAFNQDIGEWDTSKVVEMGNMFEGARAFNQDISRWDVGRVGWHGSFDEDTNPEWTADKKPNFKD